MKNKQIILIPMFLLFTLSSSNASYVWENAGREILKVKSILNDPVDPIIIYIGTERGVFKTIDAGESWRNLFVTRSKPVSVRMLSFDTVNNSKIYAATDSGLFCSRNKGLKWEKLFKGKSVLESDCLCVFAFGDSIYLGTRKGLFVSRDSGRLWKKQMGIFSDSQIFNIFTTVNNSVYFACTLGVFKSSDNQGWERVFSLNVGEDEKLNFNEETDLDKDGNVSSSRIRCLAVDANDGKTLYLGTSAGILQSKDNGLIWEYFSDAGLLSQESLFLLSSKGTGLYTVNKNGVYLLKDKSWLKLSYGLGSNSVDCLSLDAHGNLYAGTDKGLFKMSINSENEPGSFGVLQQYLSGEPDIKDVQRAAIEYAEVNRDKILRWRKQAAHKAWLPVFKVGLGRDTSELWHWEGGSTVKSCDDELRRGRDSLDWDVSLSWDLGDLIWNDAQTSIDVRSRLMVELREDIIDEVNKIYFERVRIKSEIDSLSITDRKKRFDKELRLKELTASLDALTDGYFSGKKG